MTVFARIRDCSCPGTPHGEGDGVYLRPSLSLSGGLALERDYQAALQAALAQVDPTSDEAGFTALLSQELIERWFPTSIRVGAIGWNVIGDDGPVPFDPETIIDDYALARNVADVASDLYSDAVLVPLAQRLSSISPGGPMAASTSRNGSSTRKPRGRSSRATSAATVRSTR